MKENILKVTFAINKSASDQINLVRMLDNSKFPTFFEHKGHKHNLKILKSKESNE